MDWVTPNKLVPMCHHWGCEHQWGCLRSYKGHPGCTQGLVLGPNLFTLYTRPLADLCRSHDLNYQLFADDQKIYISFKPVTTGMQSQCISSIEACIEDKRSWMNTNLLKLNDNKMEFIILGTRQQLAKSNEISIKVGNAVAKPVPNVRNLGFFLDCLLKMDSTSTKFVAIYIHYSITYTKYDHTLTWMAQKIIIQALVLSKVDHCNSLLAGTAGYQLDKLQHIQNMACIIIINLRKYDHISENMMTLYWLRIHERIM